MNAGLTIYLLFIVSWFLQLGARLPVLGAVRFDLLLVCVLCALALLERPAGTAPRSPAQTLVTALATYAVAVIPLAEWPGSALTTGIQGFVKAVVFCWFTIAFVRTERALRLFVLVFFACQAFRILEPLYLHLTTGYWGSVAYLSGGEETMDRLAGAPYDVVNPNGLGYVICVALLFLYLLAQWSRAARLAAIGLVPAFLYALLLTGSRTGIIGLGALYVGLLLRSRRRLLVAAIGGLIVLFSLPRLGADAQDRYLSIVSSETRHAATAKGRLEGLIADFEVAMRRPLFGHGLGTSAEANFNFGTSTQRSHNLIAETAQEIGFPGAALMLALIGAVAVSLGRTRARLARRGSGPLTSVVDILQLWWFVTLVFSAASYGLSSYEWYLLAGLAAVAHRLAHGPLGVASNPAIRQAPVPVLYIDLDRLLGAHGYGEIRPSELPQRPAAGAIRFLRQATRHFDVVIYGPRCRHSRGAEALARWLAAWGAPVEALRFQGDKVLPVGAGVRRIVGAGKDWPTMNQLGAFEWPLHVQR